MSLYVIYSWSVTVQGHFSVLVWLLREGITDGIHWQNHCSTLYHRTLPLPQSIPFPPSHWYCHIYCPIPACVSALFIHSLQSTHNEPPVIIHSLLRVAVLSLFSIQFIGIYLRLINRGFHLRYVSFLFSLKSGCAAVLFARHKSRFYPITHIVTEFLLHLKHAEWFLRYFSRHLIHKLLPVKESLPGHM